MTAENEAEIKALAEKLEQNCMEVCKKNSGKCPHNHEDEGEIPCYLCYAEYLFSEGYHNIENIKLTEISDDSIRGIRIKLDRDVSRYCSDTEGNFKQDVIEDMYDEFPHLIAQAQLAHNLKEIGK